MKIRIIFYSISIAISLYLITNIDWYKYKREYYQASCQEGLTHWARGCH